MYDDTHDDATPGDETAAQLGALFALALEEEPESTVTAASVLREVRAEHERAAARWTFGDWLLGGGWKWGGALVAAAALVGAVVVLPPMMGGGSADSATAGASAEMAQAYDSADEAAGEAAPADAGDGSQQEFSMADGDSGAAGDARVAADSAESEQASAAPSAKVAEQPSEESAAASAEGAADDSGNAGSGDSDSGAGEAVEGSAAGSAADEGAEQPVVGGPEMTAMPGLDPAQLDAARGALPDGAVAGVQGLGGNPGGVAGNLLVLAGGGSIEVTVQTDDGPAWVDVARQRERGLLAAEAGGDEGRVIVIASADAAVTQSDLDAIAAAVRASI